MIVAVKTKVRVLIIDDSAVVRKKNRESRIEEGVTEIFLEFT